MVVLSWTTDHERYVEFTRRIAGPLESAVQRRLAASGRTQRLDSRGAWSHLARSCKLSRWPSRTMENAFVDRVLEAVGGTRVRVPLTVLNVGTGASVLPDLAAPRVPGAIVRVAPDFAVVRARRDLAAPADAAHAAKYLVADGERLPFRDRAFPVVTCISVLEHLPAAKRLAVMKELLRVVRDGGVVVLTVDYRERSAADRCRKLLGRLRKALSLIVRGRPRAAVAPARAPNPLSWKDLVSLLAELGSVSRDAPGHVRALRSIGALREEGWEADFSYAPNRGRDYVPVGLLLTKDVATARVVEARLGVRCEVVTGSAAGAAEQAYGPRSSAGAEARESGRADPA